MQRLRALALTLVTLALLGLVAPPRTQAFCGFYVGGADQPGGQRRIDGCQQGEHRQRRAQQPPPEPLTDPASPALRSHRLADPIPARGTGGTAARGAPCRGHPAAGPLTRP